MTKENFIEVAKAGFDKLSDQPFYAKLDKCYFFAKDNYAWLLPHDTHAQITGDNITIPNALIDPGNNIGLLDLVMTKNAKAILSISIERGSDKFSFVQLDPKGRKFDHLAAIRKMEQLELVVPDASPNPLDDSLGTFRYLQSLEEKTRKCLFAHDQGLADIWDKWSNLTTR